jgi:uncharacterized membrane protein YeaQ/YmgE (transglycosylase-associated protein family)
MTIIGLILLGLLVGALGRLLHPGKDPMGWIATLALGVASVLIAGLLVGDGHGFLRFVIAVVVGVVLVAILNAFMRNRGTRSRFA